MAITAADYILWHKLHNDRVIPFRPSVLEIGEANWYGDVPLDTLRADVVRYAAEGTGDILNKRLDELIEAKGTFWLFDVAKVFYEAFLGTQDTTAVDLHGTPRAFRYDLNVPIGLRQNFQVVINTGTLEHLFNVAQGFRTVHDYCDVGGLMVHTFPFRGWLDHGFWAMNPTLLVDLEAANGYERLACCLYEPHESRLTWLEDPVGCIHRFAKEGKLAAESTIHVAWRQTTESSFVVPMQGYYGGTVSAAVREDWGAMR